MDADRIFNRFMEACRNDPMIGPTHISLFAALAHLSAIGGGNQPVIAYGREVSRYAKVSTRTYHACMKDLALRGYLRYEPSFNPARGSIIYLLGDVPKSVS